MHATWVITQTRFRQTEPHSSSAPAHTPKTPHPEPLRKRNSQQHHTPHTHSLTAPKPTGPQDRHQPPTPQSQRQEHQPHPLVALVEDGENNVMLVTKHGLAKRVSLPTMPSTQVVNRAGTDGVPVMSLKDADDQVVAAFTPADADSAAIVTAGGRLLRIAVDKVRPQGRAAGGVAGVALSDGDEVVAAGAVEADASQIVVVLTDGENLKASSAEDYPMKGRGTSGVRCIAMKSADSRVTSALVTNETWSALTASGKTLSTSVDLVKRDASGVQAPSANSVAIQAKR